MKRLKFAIETSTSCIGSCLGCALTVAQRSSQTPVVYSTGVFFNSVETFYKDYIKVIGNNHEYVIIELVVGEHFNFQEDYLHNLFKNLSSFLRNTGKKIIVAISTSGLIIPSKLEPKMQIMTEYFSKEEMEIHMVCNLNEYQKYKGKYNDCLELCAKYFGHLNILINFDNKVSLDSCNGFAEMLNKYGVTNFQLVYGLKQHNYSVVGYDDQLFFNIYSEILKGLDNGFRQNDIREVMLNHKGYSEDLYMPNLIRDTSDKWYKEQLFIDHEGGVYNLVSTMLGGIELDDRAGFEETTSIFKENAVEEYFKNKDKVYKKLLKTYLSEENCQGCKIKEQCYSMGIPMLTKFLIKDGKCFNPIIPFFENKESILNTYNDKMLMDFKAQGLDNN